MKKIFAIVEYIGSHYQGWQTQKQGNTIQDELQRVLSKILNEEVVIYGSGRTDAGVHAFGQTFHFLANKESLDLSMLMHGVNCLISKDIKIRSMSFVDESFHARFSAKKKKYIYYFALNDVDVFHLPFCEVVHDPFCIDKLNEALQLFVGKHCFVNFTSKEEDENNFIRNVEQITLSKCQKNIYSIEFVGDGFMRYMIRFIVGTCFAYAKGQINSEFIVSRLNNHITQKTFYKASPNGLFLKEVIY